MNNKDFKQQQQEDKTQKSVALFYMLLTGVGYIGIIALICTGKVIG